MGLEWSPVEPHIKLVSIQILLHYILQTVLYCTLFSRQLCNHLNYTLYLVFHNAVINFFFKSYNSQDQLDAMSKSKYIQSQYVFPIIQCSNYFINQECAIKCQRSGLISFKSKLILIQTILFLDIRGYNASVVLRPTAKTFQFFKIMEKDFGKSISLPNFQ